MGSSFFLARGYLQRCSKYCLQECEVGSDLASHHPIASSLQLGESECESCYSSDCGRPFSADIFADSSCDTTRTPIETTTPLHTSENLPSPQGPARERGSGPEFVDNISSVPPTLDIHLCSYCALSFQSKGLLNRHLKQHTRPFECSIEACHDRFRYRKDRNRHEQSLVHASSGRPTRTFSCPEPDCPFRTNRRDNLARHRRRIHGGNITGHISPTGP